MSEFKGTKGKWEVYTPDHIGCTNVKFGRDILDGFVEIWHHQSSNEEAKANAQLISKAPEMLEMLKEAKRVICSMKLSMWVHPDCSEGSEFYDIATTGEETEDKIEQLIKEATTI